MTQRRQIILELARNSVEACVRTGRPPTMPDGLPEDLLQERAGVFVSLKQNGRLRGCIGTLAPTRPNLAMEIRDMACEAARHDPRFDPVTPQELDSLQYSVDVLKPPERIESEDRLDPQRYGVIVSNGWRRGVLLPGLEGIDQVADQLAIALRKAGIAAHEPYDLERFEVIRYGEAEDPS